MFKRRNLFPPFFYANKYFDKPNIKEKRMSMYVGTIFKKDNSVEIKTIKIELIKKNFDEKLSSIKLNPEKITAPGIVLITPSIK